MLNKGEVFGYQDIGARTLRGSQNKIVLKIGMQAPILASQPHI